MGPKRAKPARKRPRSPVPDITSSDTTASPVETRSKRTRFSLFDPQYIPECPCPGVVVEGITPPSLDTQEQQETSTQFTTEIRNPNDEERIDWYMEMAMTKLKGTLRRANEDKLSLADLWELLTFGQYMYAGMKEEHGIDLNKALVDRTVKNMTKGLTPQGQPDQFPWGIPAPRRCYACTRVVVEDLDPLSPRRPWNRRFATGNFQEYAHRLASGFCVGG